MDSKSPSFFSYTNDEKIQAAVKVTDYFTCMRKGESNFDLAGTCKIGALKQGRLGEIVKPMMLHYELGLYVKMRERESGRFVLSRFGLTLGYEKGQKISAGEIISTMGQTDDGNIHLHFEIRKKGLSVDPMSYFKSRT